MKLTLCTQAAQDSENIASSAEDLVNLYAEQAPGDAVTRMNLRGVLGESGLVDTGGVLPRAVTTVNDVMYASLNGDLWSINSAGSANNRGTMTASAETSMAGNNGNVTVAAGGTYYLWDGTTLSTPSVGAFSNVGSVEFTRQYTVLTEGGGRRFTWSDPATPGTINAANVKSAEGRDDNILRGVAHGEVLYLFKERSIEAWYVTGQSGTSAFQRMAGGVLDDGLKGYKLVAAADDGIFFVGDDNTAKILAGNIALTVSTPAVNTDLSAETPTQVYIYEDRGHTFGCIRFANRKAWCYDFQTKLWHRRAYGLGAWKTLEVARAGGVYHGFDASGRVYRMARSSADTDRALRRVATTKPLFMDGRKFTVRKLQFLARMGRANLGRDAKVVLEVSGDGGLTWSDEMEASLGGLGEYDTQAEYFALGRYEQFNARFTVADAADVTFYSDVVVELG